MLKNESSFICQRLTTLRGTYFLCHFFACIVVFVFLSPMLLAFSKADFTIQIERIKFIIFYRGATSKSPTMNHSPTMYGDPLSANLQVYTIKIER